MKKHLIVALCLVILYFITERIVGGFDPKLAPVWLMPTLFLWMISFLVALDKRGIAKQIYVALFISLLAICGAGFVSILKSSKTDLGMVYVSCFVILIIAGGVIAITSIFYDAETYDKSKLVTHAISLGQFTATIASLTLI